MIGTRRSALVMVLVTACARVQAPPPPAGAPALSQELTVPGTRLAVAAKSARTLGDLSYTTRRFGSDSTWGYRAGEGLAVRLRYSMPSRDSTRLLLEFWGRCEERGVSCLRGELALLASAIVAVEAPPP
ncbi:MAG: hypothetical protein WKG32_21210 [Gemmatimonadaceae bacterium]